MRTLVVLLATALCCAVEGQFLFGRDIPYLHHHRYAVGNPFTPVLPHTHIHHDIVPGLPQSIGLKSQYYDRDYTGQAKYGHVEPGQRHYAVQDAYGNKIGGFSYYNAEGKLVQTSYVADGAGYRVSSNDLPKDTPEVRAAKISHLAEHEKLKLVRSKRDASLISPASTVPIVSPLTHHLPLSHFPHSHIDYRISSPIPHAYPTTLTVPVVKPDGFLADTPEVVAAKAHHFAEVAAAKYRNYSPYVPITPTIHTPLPHIDYRYTPHIPHVFPTTHGIPLVTGDGFLADTPEVVAAKAYHFSEVAKARARAGYPFHF